MTNSRGRPRHPDILTPAEWRVLEHIRHGRTNLEIAAQLGLSVNTVRYHVSNILAKLELRDREAVRRWRGGSRRSGWSALGSLGFSKVAMLSAAIVASAVLISGSISVTRGGDGAGTSSASQTGAVEIAPIDEPTVTPSTTTTADTSESPVAEGNPPAGTRSTLLPLVSAAPTSSMCREQSDAIAETFGPHETYAAIAVFPPELVATGSAHWVNVDGCVVHGEPLDLEQLFAAMDLPASEIPTNLSLQCLLADPLIPPGTRLAPIPAEPGAEAARIEHRLVTETGDPLPRPITVIAYCDMTGGGLRVGLSGSR